jgi:tetratricopeptide (TPR) repeat protein
MSERTRVLLMLTVAMLIYANTLQHSFVFDDEIYITGNRQVTHPSLRLLFSAVTNNHFRPLTFAAFVLETRIGGWQPFVFHLISILLHAAVTLLLYLVVRKLFESVPKAGLVAFAAALLFAVHPIHSEVVDWASAQSELLAAGFLLAAWLAHLHGRPLVALLCFVLALLSKESAVAFLPLLMIGDYLRHKFSPAIHYLGMAVGTIAYFPLLWLVQGRHFQHAMYFLDNPLAYLPIQWRILNALRIAWKYVGLQLYPGTLSCDYSYNAIVLYMKWGHVLFAVMATAVVVGLWVWVMYRRKTEWALAGAIYFAGFAVTANLVLPTGTIMGERLAYFPSAGFCVLMAVVWSRLERHRPELAWALLAIAVLTLGGRTVVRNWDWRSDYTLFSAGVRAVPGSSKMHADLGIANYYLGRLGPARQELETAIHIYPDLPQGVAYLGLVEAGEGRDEEARRTLEKAVAMTPRADFNYRVFSVILAAQLIKLNKDDEALRFLIPVISEWPDYSRAWYNRALIEFRRGETSNARKDLETALRLEPTYGQAQQLLRALNASAGPPKETASPH